MTAADTKALEALQADFAEPFGQLAELQRNIHLRLTDYADGKRLKGNEIVGWLGEIYGKTLFGGALASDSEEHDFVTPAGWRVSVKTRKGWGKGWRRTSAVPKFEGDECPSHLLFVHLDDSYLIDRIWLFDWRKLAAAGRFKRHVVRGAHRSYIFMLDEKRDQANIVYSGVRHREFCEEFDGD